MKNYFIKSSHVKRWENKNNKLIGSLQGGGPWVASLLMQKNIFFFAM
jgi:hypothetical protein